MPIRLTCPSCSATLSVKDEFAGRAVKCPKCNGVIPAAKPAPAAPVPPPPPAKTAPPPDASADDEKPAKGGAKVTGKPVGKSKDDEDEDDDRPRKKPRDDEDDDRGPKRRGARGDKDDDDRPRRKRRDDEDDDRPRRGSTPPAAGGVMVVLIICGTLLLICGGVGFAIYRFVYAVKETVEKKADEFQRAFSPVTQDNYKQLVLGKTTRAQAEAKLGAGRMATGDDMAKALGTDLARAELWATMAARQRAVIWQNGDDYILCAFHPNAEGEGRLQMKDWRPRNGANLSLGDTSDTEFLRMYPPPKPADPNAPKPSAPQSGDKTGPVISVSAEDLIDDYKEDRLAADKRYLSKKLLITGVVDSWENEFTAHVVAPNKPTIIRVVFLDEQQAQIAKYKKGDTIRFRGTFTSGIGIMAVNRGWIVP